MFTNKKNTRIIRLHKVCLTSILGGLVIFNTHASVLIKKDANVPIKKTIIFEKKNAKKDFSDVLNKEVNKEDFNFKIDSNEIQKQGGSNFGNIFRYYPSVSAISTAAGLSSMYSYDREGYSSFNIRGLEGNRVSIDINNVEIPYAPLRTYDNIFGADTFSIGRGDFFDPYMYKIIGINEGITDVHSFNRALGGEISFYSKSASDYLSPLRSNYVGYSNNFNSEDNSLRHSLILAFGNYKMQGLMIASKTNGKEITNLKKSSLYYYPADWYSDAFLISGNFQENEEHLIIGIMDYYYKIHHATRDLWSNDKKNKDAEVQQINQTWRWTFSLEDKWIPLNGTSLADQVNTKFFYQNAKSNDVSYRFYYPIPHRLSSIFTSFNTKSYGIQIKAKKEHNIHNFFWGIGTKIYEINRTANENPSYAYHDDVCRPEIDSKGYTANLFFQDSINLNFNKNSFVIIPGIHIFYQYFKPINFQKPSKVEFLTVKKLKNIYNHEFSNIKILPSIKFIYKITPKIDIYTQYKQGAQPYNSSQLYGTKFLSGTYSKISQDVLINNDKLKMEIGDELKFGIQGELIRGINFNAFGFYNTYKNFIDYVKYNRSSKSSAPMFKNIPLYVKNVLRPENRNKAYIYGAESNTKFNFSEFFPKLDGLNAKIGVIFSKGMKTSECNVQKYIDLNSVPPIRVIFGLNYDNPNDRYGASLMTILNKRKKAQSNDTTILSCEKNNIEHVNIFGYVLADLTTYFKINDSIKVTGSIYNIGNKKYRDYMSSRDLEQTQKNSNIYDYALSVKPGRTYQIGIDISF